jgi:hypothetical protein
MSCRQLHPTAAVGDDAENINVAAADYVLIMKLQRCIYTLYKMTCSKILLLVTGNGFIKFMLRMRKSFC